MFSFVILEKELFLSKPSVCGCLLKMCLKPGFDSPWVKFSIFIAYHGITC